jgi:hypothetical protein
MTVIERDKAMHVGKHWFCPGCDTFDGPHHEGYCTVCHEDGTNDATVKEVVPADDFQQAVATLRLIATWPHSPAEPLTHSDAKAMTFEARAALDSIKTS